MQSSQVPPIKNGNSGGQSKSLGLGVGNVPIVLSAPEGFVAFAY